MAKKENKYTQKDGSSVNRSQNSRGSNRSSRPYESKGHAINMNKLVSNDVSYYNKNKYEYEQSTKLPWDQWMGNSLRWQDLLNGSNPVNNNISFPGIMKVDFVYGPGYASDSQDPVNRAFTMLIADIYARTSGSSLQYQQPDLACFFTSTASISNMIAVIQRALKASQFRVNRNIFYPKALCASMGVDYNDLVTNINKYASRLNAAIRAFNAMKIPNFLDVYQRQFSLCHNVYVDEDSVLGQIIYFMPKGFYIYKDTESQAVWTDIDNDPYGGSPHTVLDKWLGNVELMIDAWYRSDDFYTINGSIQRAYKDADFLTIPEFSLNDTLNPVVDEVIMSQVMNATICDYAQFNKASLNITQHYADGIIKWKPAGVNTGSGRNWHIPYETMLLRSNKNDVSADDIAEMTRLVAFPEHVVDKETQTITEELVGCGPEVVTGIKVYTYSRDIDQINVISLSGNMYYFGSKVNMREYRLSLKELIHVSNFRFCPYITIKYEDTDAKTFDAIGILGDIYNYTYYGRNAYKQLNSTCMYSLWTIRPATKVSNS